MMSNSQLTKCRFTVTGIKCEICKYVHLKLMKVTLIRQQWHNNKALLQRFLEKACFHDMLPYHEVTQNQPDQLKLPQSVPFMSLCKPPDMLQSAILTTM